MKAQYLPNHVFVGIFTYFAAAFTAVIGIQEKNSANSCGYDVTLTEPDLNPSSHYWDLYAGCRLSNGLGECLPPPRLCCAHLYADCRLSNGLGECRPPPRVYARTHARTMDV